MIILLPSHEGYLQTAKHCSLSPLLSAVCGIHSKYSMGMGWNKITTIIFDPLISHFTLLIYMNASTRWTAPQVGFAFSSNEWVTFSGILKDSLQVTGSCILVP